MTLAVMICGSAGNCKWLQMEIIDFSAIFLWKLFVVIYVCFALKNRLVKSAKIMVDMCPSMKLAVFSQYFRFEILDEQSVF